MAIIRRRRVALEPEKSTRIGSVRRFLDALEKIERKDDLTLLYRGHPRFTYLLLPSIYRDPRLVAKEHIMFKELILRCPNDFASSASTFQTLVKMQHYGLPTRLLDLTMNPLIALFFACEQSATGESGEVISFAIPKVELKYYDSDTVSVIANISRRPATDFFVPAGGESINKFNGHKAIRYLLHEIKQEKPYFEPLIEREHLETVVCVRPKLENPRIIRQDGAFLLFGVDGSKSNAATIPASYQCYAEGDRILIIDSEKKKIRTQLEALGITHGTVYPEIDRVAEFLRAHYAPPISLTR